MNSIKKHLNLNLCKKQLPWTFCYHCIMFASWIQYAWMVLWLIIKMNNNWKDYWWLIFMLCVAQGLLAIGLLGIIALSIMQVILDRKDEKVTKEIRRSVVEYQEGLTQNSNSIELRIPSSGISSQATPR